MGLKLFSVPVATCLTIFLHSGFSLECYYCNGKTLADCRDPFSTGSNSTGLVNCSTLRAKSLNVLKVYHSMFNAVNNLTVVGPEPHVCYKYYDGDFPLRGCSQPDFCNNHTTTICELCDNDGCNNASEIYKSFTLIFIYFIIFLLFVIFS